MATTDYVPGGGSPTQTGAFDPARGLRTGKTVANPAIDLGPSLSPYFGPNTGDNASSSDPRFPGAPVANSDTSNRPIDGGTSPETKTPDQLLNDLKTMPADQLRALQARLKRAGFDGIRITGHIDAATATAYGQLISTVSSEQQAQPDSKITVDSYLNDLIADADANGASSGPKNKKTTEVDLTDPYAARALIEDAMSKKLGRHARPDEIAAFTAALNGTEKSNPQVSDSTVTSSGGDASAGAGAALGLDTSANTDTNTTVSGGVNQAGYTDQYLHDHFSDEQAGADRAQWYNLALQILSQPATGSN